MNGITELSSSAYTKNKKNNTLRENLILDSFVIIESMLHKGFIRERFKSSFFIIYHFESNSRFFFNFNPEALTRIIGL